MDGLLARADKAYREQNRESVARAEELWSTAAACDRTRVDGLIGMVRAGTWLADHLKSWVWTIAGGSDQIQRNIVGERVLGLPRDPLVD